MLRSISRTPAAGLMLNVFRFVLPAFVLCSIATSALAQTIPLSGGTYTQDFDTLSNAAGSTNNAALPNGWLLNETGGGARDNEQYAVDTGSGNTGDTYSYGVAGSTDRALGSIRSGTLMTTTGACFNNATGNILTSFDIAYTGEQWRLGTASRTDALNFEYSLNATSLTTGTWTGVAALNFVSRHLRHGGCARRQRCRQPHCDQCDDQQRHHRQWRHFLYSLERYRCLGRRRRSRDR
jgi:hypothetical protein